MGAAEKLDSCIKAAEVTARYLAVLALSSSASTREPSVPPPSVDNFAGNLSFGMFEKAARAGYAVGWEHPLKSSLRSCLKSSKLKQAIAGVRLEEFVQLRNELGHALTPSDEARARSIIERSDPIGGVVDLVEGLAEVLNYPLLVVLSQHCRRGRVAARIAFFSGEGEPIPREIELQDPIFEWEVPYVCTADGLLPLVPGLLYEPRASDGRFGLHLIDAIDERGLRYKGLHDDRIITRTECIGDMGDWVCLPFETRSSRQKGPTIERINSFDGRSLFGFLSGSEIPTASVGAATSVKEGSKAEPDIESARDFEQRLNSLGLGAVYRDILYCFADRGARAELNGETVRIITNSEPNRVLATIQLTSRPSIVVGLLVGALTKQGDDVTEPHELKAGEEGDALVARIRILMGNDSA